jgi:hypothetical protein
MPIRKILQMTSDREFDSARTKVFRAITLLELPKTWGVVAIPSGDFSDGTTLTICILSYTFVYSCKSVNYAKHYPFFLSSVLSSAYLLIVGVEVIVALDHTQTHKLGRTPLDEGSARRRTSTWQRTTPPRDRHPCLRRDSNPQWPQASGRRPTP